jgi:GDPmannose 4,6-dehydratase
MKIALITGVTGQDGSFLAELLLDKGYEVHGIIRRSSSFNTGRIDHLYHDVHSSGVPLYLHYGDLLDSGSLRMLMMRVHPDEVYNLGAQSHVKVSFEQPEYTANVTGLGCLRLLDAVRDAQEDLGKQIRFYQASSSEMYGKVREVPQTELTPFYPRSPYACAKVYSFWQTVNYREAYGMHCSNGILFNHESERRGETFVTRKITRALTRICCGLQESLFLGNLDARRDWGYAADYVAAMHAMLQRDEADDYVIATNVCHSVREFVEAACAHLGIAIEWRGEGVDTEGFVAGVDGIAAGDDMAITNGQRIVAVDPRYFRPAEVDLLRGDPARAAAQLDWRPTTSFERLVAIMADHDIQLAARERRLAQD